MLFPVVLCGGTGSRLWPVCRPGRPKHSLALNGHKTLLEETLGRIMTLRAQKLFIGRSILITDTANRSLLTPGEHLLLIEPEPLGTACAVALAAHAAREEQSDAWLLVLPSDHYLEDITPLASAIVPLLAPHNQGLYCIGVKATSPNPNFGYLLTDPSTQSSSDALPVMRFHEKPSEEHAAKLLAQHRAWWNTGMFLLHARRYLDALEQHAPEIHASAELLWHARRDDGGATALAAPVPRFPKLSLDYAVMEKAHHLSMIPLAAAWRDLGTWESIYEHLPKDEQGNATVGRATHENCRNCLFYSEGEEIRISGLTGMAVISSGGKVCTRPLGDSHTPLEMPLIHLD